MTYTTEQLKEIYKVGYGLPSIDGLRRNDWIVTEVTENEDPSKSAVILDIKVVDYKAKKVKKSFSKEKEYLSKFVWVDNKARWY